MSIIEDDIFLELMNGYSRLVVKTNTQMVKIFKTKQIKVKKYSNHFFQLRIAIYLAKIWEHVGWSRSKHNWAMFWLSS